LFATIFIIFLKINLPDLVKFKQYLNKQRRRQIFQKRVKIICEQSKQKKVWAVVAFLTEPCVF